MPEHLCGPSLCVSLIRFGTAKPGITLFGVDDLRQLRKQIRTRACWNGQRESHLHLCELSSAFMHELVQICARTGARFPSSKSMHMRASIPPPSESASLSASTSGRSKVNQMQRRGCHEADSERKEGEHVFLQTHS